MAIGDDALAAGMTLVNGATTPANTIDDEINLTRDNIAQGKGATDAATPGKVIKRDANGRAKIATPSAASDIATKGYVDSKVGTLGAVASEDVVPVEMGGTNATTAAAARTNLAVVQQSGGTIRLRWDQPTLNWVPAINGSETSPLARHDQMNAALAGRVAKTGDTMTGDLYLPNSSSATSGYTICYIDGTGRVSRGASTERVKKFISDIDPLSLGTLFPVFKRWQMRHGDGLWRYGYTAEQLATDPITEPFVIYERHIEEDGTAPHLERDAFGRPIPLSIDFIGLLLAQVAQLHARDQQREMELEQLADRITALEAAR